MTMKKFLTICTALLVTASLQSQTPGTAEKGFARAAVAVASKNAAATNAVVAKSIPDPAVMAIRPTAPSAAVAEPPKHDGLRRDPFINPIVKTANGPAITCTTGKRCL